MEELGHTDWAGANQEVRGNVPIRGTANIPSFQYYKIEVGAGPNPEPCLVTVVVKR
jgi:hypothetical protein